MKEMVACCGLDCAQCGAYRATMSNDDGLRKQTAKEWSAMYGGEIKAEDIKCMGCKSDILYNYCPNCGIRACSISNNTDNCAVCRDFGCSKIAEFMSMAPEAKKNLDKIRKTL